MDVPNNPMTDTLNLQIYKHPKDQTKATSMKETYT